MINQMKNVLDKHGIKSSQELLHDLSNQLIRLIMSRLKAHGGKLWVESEEKLGSTFRFTFPLSKD